MVIEMAREVIQIISIVLMCLILRESSRNSRRIDRQEWEISLIKAELELTKHHRN